MINYTDELTKKLYIGGEMTALWGTGSDNKTRLQFTVAIVPQVNFSTLFVLSRNRWQDDFVHVPRMQSTM